MKTNIVRITTPLQNEPPLVRSVGINVWDILRWLAAGRTEAEIRAENPGLEHEDFLAVFGYAALVGEHAGLADRMKEIQAGLPGMLEGLKTKEVSQK